MPLPLIIVPWYVFNMWTLLINNSYRGQICRTHGQQHYPVFPILHNMLKSKSPGYFSAATNKQHTAPSMLKENWMTKNKDLFSHNELKHWMQCHSNICPPTNGNLYRKRWPKLKNTTWRGTQKIALITKGEKEPYRYHQTN